VAAEQECGPDGFAIAEKTKICMGSAKIEGNTIVVSSQRLSNRLR
jgi:hypothetical protein